MHTMHTCSFIQGRIISGLKSRIKDFHRTPKHMIHVPSKPRARNENIPSTPDSGDAEGDVSFDKKEEEEKIPEAVEQE